MRVIPCAHEAGPLLDTTASLGAVQWAVEGESALAWNGRSASATWQKG